MTTALALPTAVRDLAGGLLDVAADALTTSVEAEQAPEHRYVAHGVPTWDCEQLTVHVRRMEPKLLDPTQDGCLVIWLATFVVALVRCAPKGTERNAIPTREAMDTAFRQFLVDGYTLVRGLSTAWKTGQWPVGAHCRKVTWGSLEPRQPEGGFMGWQLDVRVELA